MSTKATWHLTASTASRLASPLSGGRGFVIAHARVSSLTHHRAPWCAGSKRAPVAAGIPGCAESQAKGHPMGWGTAEGMWQLAFGSGHAQAPLTWKSAGQGALGFSKIYHPAVALQGNFIL